MPKIIWTVLSFLFVLSATAQNKHKADSLLQLVESVQSENDRYKLYRDLAYYHPDAIEGLDYAEQAFQIAVQHGDSIQKAAALESISSQHRLLGNKLEAFKAAFSALRIYESLGNLEDQAVVNIQLGSNFGIDQNYIESGKYLRAGLAIYEQLQDTFYIAIANINLGETLRLGGMADSATICLHTALHLNQWLADEQIEGYAMGNLGMIAAERGDFAEALVDLEAAIAILTELGDTYSVSVYQAEIGKIYLQEKQVALGEKYLLEALALAQQEQLKEQIRDISEILSNFYQKKESYQLSLKYQRIFQVYQDSLVNKENIQRLEQLNTTYKLDKKESEIAFLEERGRQQRSINLGLIGGVSLLLSLAAFLYWNIRQKRKAYHILTEKKQIIEQREQEKALLLKELNHRVKNNLQMISSLLNLQSNQLKDHPAVTALTAGKLRVEAMSLIHQKLYQEDHQTQIPIKTYIEELVYNLQFAYARKTKLNLQIQDLNLDIDLAIPLALIVNELVINAFKYAYQNIEESQLLIELNQRNNVLQLLVQDNGIGMQSVDWESTTSFGLKLVHSLTQQLEGKIYMTNEDGCAWHLMIHPKIRLNSSI